MLTAGPTSDPVNRAGFSPAAWLGFQNKSSLTTWVQVEPKIPPRGFSVWNFNTQMSLTLISQNESFSGSTEPRYLFTISHSYRLSVLAMNKEAASHYLRWFKNNNEYNLTLKITTCLSFFGGFLRECSGEGPTCQCWRPNTQARSLGRKNPLEKETATHSSILAWKIAWTEDAGGLQSVGSPGVGDNQALITHTQPPRTYRSAQETARCYVAAWLGGQFGEWIHAYVWLSPFPVHLKLSQHCLLIG